MEQLRTKSEIDEEQLKLQTLEDCLNLALKLRILSKSPDEELSTCRLSLRLTWFLLHSRLPIQSLRRLQLLRLGKDLAHYLATSPSARRVSDLNRYRFPEVP